MPKSYVKEAELPNGEVMCTRCDGKITLTSEEWATKGFHGMRESDCKLCQATGSLKPCTRCDGKKRLTSEEWLGWLSPTAADYARTESMADRIEPNGSFERQCKDLYKLKR